MSVWPGQRDGDDPVGEFQAVWERDGEAANPEAFLSDRPEASPRDRLDVLLVDQARRWSVARPRMVGDYLKSFPDLAANPEAHFDLAFGEYRARRKNGEAIDPTAFAETVPEEIRGDLMRQLRVHEALRDEDPDRTATALRRLVETWSPAEDDRRQADPTGYTLGERLGIGGMGVV